jgi:hypothetical protein
MYLAQIQKMGRRRFVIRQSFRQGDGWHSRDLFDLGSRPQRFLHYPGGNAFYVDAAVEAALEENGVALEEADLETLFWPFIDPEIKRALSFFRDRARSHRPIRRPSIDPSRVHLFDKRRLHYLRYGQMDQGAIGRLPAKLWAPAVDKSRDELEQQFMVQERILAPHERKVYVFVIFDLQRFFPGDAVKVMPQLAAVERLDERFIECLCRLNADDGFWGGTEAGGRLHDYLVRYAIMYFDHDFGRQPEQFLADWLHQFINQRRRHRPPKPSMDPAAAGRVMGLSPEALAKMDRRRLARVYRRLARCHHPDQGGDAAAFIRITEAYQQLKRRLKDGIRR